MEVIKEKKAKISLFILKMLDDQADEGYGKWSSRNPLSDIAYEKHTGNLRHKILFICHF